MQDDNNRKNTDALLMADGVIANALRQKELEEAESYQKILDDNNNS